jgi:murein L,D-transpeptidase YcbB/YkuD
VAEVKRALRFAVIGLFLSSAAALAEDDRSPVRIRTLVEQLRTDGQVRIGTASVSSTRILPEFYGRRDFRNAWERPQVVAEFTEALADVHRDGLDPQDYHLAELQQRRTQGQKGHAQKAEASADLDFLLTDALARLVAHLLSGKVDPVALESNWNLMRNIGDADPADMLQRLLNSEQIASELQRLRPSTDSYQRLRAALADYRKIRNQGGWPDVADGPSLKRGMRDPRVGVVRQRLQITGDVAGNPPDHDLFDKALRRGVIRFQKRHRLTADGVVGPQTRAAMNVPVKERIGQIRVNLERARWLPRTDPGDFIMVDTASSELTLLRKNEPVWNTDVRIGKQCRRTPVLTAAMNRLVLNPAWTVPPSALRETMWSAARRDPAYLADKKLEVIDANGNIVPTESLDGPAFSAHNPRFQLRQKPGADNALGRIKFDFPNPHDVYLHDTPNADLFQHSTQSFSSGCIRVENPLGLATRLMEDDNSWSAEALEQAIDSESTQIVRLGTPFPVLVLYRTVSVNENGTVTFQPDVEQRDAAVLRKLNSRFRSSQR